MRSFSLRCLHFLFHAADEMVEQNVLLDICHFCTLFLCKAILEGLICSENKEISRKSAKTLTIYIIGAMYVFYKFFPKEAIAENIVAVGEDDDRIVFDVQYIDPPMPVSTAMI